VNINHADAAIAVIRRSASRLADRIFNLACILQRPHGGDRDESARLPLLSAGLESNRIPHRKIAAKLAVVTHSTKIPNDITRKTPACFEPTLDYVVVKIPKWQFEKFPGADESSAEMKSMGEVWPSPYF